MKEKIAFDARVNANNSIVVPYTTRIRYDIRPGQMLKIEIVDIDVKKE